MIRSSILAFLVDKGHQVYSNKAFKVILNIPSNLPYSLLVRLLYIAAAIGIYVDKLNL